MTVITQVLRFFVGLFQWWVIVAPWQQAVRVRFGKRTALLGPGVHFKLPVFDVIFVQPIRIRAQFLRSQTVMTGDGKALTVAAAIQYEIADLLKLYRTAHDVHDLIEQIAQSVLAKHVESRMLADLGPASIEEALSAIDLSAYGLKTRGFSVIEFASVKTFRLIDGAAGHFQGYDQRIETSVATSAV